MALVGSLLLPDQRPAVIELLQTVDRLTAAERSLRDAVAFKFGRASASAFDHSEVANVVGVFSRDVEILGERIDGDHAVVTVQVGGRVPLDQVNLALVDGEWRIRTDAPIPGLAGELNRLADVFSSLTRRATEGTATLEELRRELDSRAAEVFRRIQVLTEKQTGPSP